MERPFHLDAIAVLPDHLHFLWTLPPDDANYSTRWRLIEASFARSMAPGERLSDRRPQKGERGIWQCRFWERAIRDRRDFERHRDYFHYNPVQTWPCDAGGRLAPFERRFVENGTHPSDWAGHPALADVVGFRE